MNVFNLDEQFNQYLKLMRFDMSKMPEIQHKELKRAFYCGMAQLFKLFKEDMPELSDEDGFKTLNYLDEQLNDFVKTLK